MNGYFQPAPREFIDFAQQVIDSTENYREILLNSKFEKKEYALMADVIEREIILINMFKKECGENVKVDEEQSWIHTVHDSRNNKIDTVCIVMFSCKNKKYKGNDEWQNWQSVPEYIKFGPEWVKKKRCLGLLRF
jgi:hypothetical protein